MCSLNDIIKDENFELNQTNFSTIKLPNQPRISSMTIGRLRKRILAQAVHGELRPRPSRDHRSRAGDRRDAGNRNGAEGRVTAMSLRVASLAFAGAAVVAASAAHADGDKALGQFLSSECVTCHQITGRYEGIPPIVGWPKPVFIEIMGEYRAQKRANPIMQTIAVRLTEGEIAALAAYFGSLQPAN